VREKDRGKEKLRNLKIIPHVNCWAEGSVEISIGQTKLLCTASVSENTPHWLNRSGWGWLTAEYAMLPRSGDFRMNREKAFQGGRCQEISRLIGRSLRAAVDLQNLGERQITIDCDVLQADGGTRTAGITGGFIALSLALKNLKDRSIIKNLPLKHYVCAISMGLKRGEICLDLNSQEDKSCDADINFIMNEQNQFIEIQGTAEKQSFSAEQMQKMMLLALKAGAQLREEQKKIIGDFFPVPKIL